MKSVCRQLFLFTLFITIFSLYSSAYNFSVDVVPVKNDIMSNETARFLLLINNTSPRNVVFSIYGPEVEWAVSTDPTIDSNKKVYQHSTGETIIMIKPSGVVDTGMHGVPVVIKDTVHKEVMKVPLFVNLKSIVEEKRMYLPSIKVSVDMPHEVDPTQEFKLSVLLENQNKLQIDDVRVSVQSDLAMIQKEYTTSIGPWGTEEGRKSIDFRIKFDEKQPPVDDVVRFVVTAVSMNKSYDFGPFATGYSVVEYGEISESVKTEESFLIVRKEITLTNNGNSRKTEEYRIANPMFRRIYTSAEPEGASRVIDGRRFLAWDVEIEVGEDAVIVVVVNYRPLFWTIILIIVSIISYYYFRSPVVVHKTATVTQCREGGIAEISVQLNIINRALKPVAHVHVSDKIPDMLDIVKEFKIGTIHPSKILKHGKKGTIVKYEIDKLEKKEERIITYNAKAKLCIVGEFTLPFAVIKYRKEGEEKIRISRSNMVKMSDSAAEI